jgi:integrase
MRDSAIASLKLKHVNIKESLIEQLPDQVKTKFSKTIYTYFFPIEGSAKDVVMRWINYLREIHLYDEEAPVFPRTKIVVSANNEFRSAGIEPIHWKTANPIREVFKAAFALAGLEYYSPHSFRNTLVRFGEKKCRTPEEFKAWSQNLGHESPLTTFSSYGYIEPHNQGDIIKKIGTQRNPSQEEKLDRILAAVTKGATNS